MVGKVGILALAVIGIFLGEVLFGFLRNILFRIIQKFVKGFLFVFFVFLFFLHCQQFPLQFHELPVVFSSEHQTASFWGHFT